MAITKAKTMANGAQGDYWRILTITLDRQTFTATGQIALFKDQATSNAGAPHLGLIKTFKFPYTNMALMAAPSIIAFVYGKIMDQAEVMVSVDLSGASVTPHYADPDIAGGTVG